MVELVGGQWIVPKTDEELTDKLAVTSIDDETETQPLLSASVCAETTPLPASTTSRCPAPSSMIPRGSDRPVATTCILYPEAIEGWTLPEGDGPHDDCASARAGRAVAATAVKLFRYCIFIVCPAASPGRTRERRL